MAKRRPPKSSDRPLSVVVTFPSKDLLEALVCVTRPTEGLLANLERVLNLQLDKYKPREGKITVTALKNPKL